MKKDDLGMRTEGERIELIHRRTAEIKEENRKKRQRIMGISCFAVCMLVIIGLGIMMPGLMQNAATSTTVAHNSGAASLIGSSSALGYIMVGILSFVLGVAVTISLFYLRKKEEKVSGENA